MIIHTPEDSYPIVEFSIPDDFPDLENQEALFRCVTLGIQALHLPSSALLVAGYNRDSNTSSRTTTFGIPYAELEETMHSRGHYNRVIGYMQQRAVQATIPQPAVGVYDLAQLHLIGAEEYATPHDRTLEQTLLAEIRYNV